MSKILVIELSDADAKLLQASKNKNDFVIEFAKHVSFEGLDKSEESDATRRSLLAAATKEIKGIAQDIIVTIPKQSVTLRESILPTSDPLELANMVIFEAEKIIPFNVERHTISYSITDGPTMEGTEVMIAAIDEPIIHQWLNLVKDVKAEPKQVDVSCLSVSHAALVEMPVEDTPECYAIFQVTHQCTDVTIIVEGKILSARSIPRLGIESLLETIPGDSTYESWLQKNIHAVFTSMEDSNEPIEKWFKKMTTQWQRTIEFAQRDFKVPPIQHVVIAGDGAAIPGFSDLFADKMNMTVFLLNPLEKAKKEKNAIIESDRLPCFATAFGAANRYLMYHELDSINLLPAQIIEQQEAAEKKLHLLVTGLMATVFIVMGFIYFNTTRNDMNEEIENIRTYLSDLDQLVEQLDDREERIEIIRQIRSEQAGALDILGRISVYSEIGSHTLHDGRLTVSNFEFELGDEVRIDGYAMDTEDITEFVRYLSALENKGSSIFDNVDIRNQDPTRLPRRDNQIYQFRIEAPLSQGD